VPLYGLSAVYLEPLIKLLTGLDEVAHDVIMVGHILLLAVFSSQLTNSCTKRILMMCGYEKKLLYVSLVEAGANFVISVCLALTIGMVGVAIGSLVPTVLVGWLWVLPMALKYTDLKLFAYVQYLFSESTPLILFAVCLGLTLFFLPMPEEGGFLNLCLRGSLSAGPAMAVILYRIKRVM
jgi:O-antigen/teichoic acid export membrane protein